MHVLKDSVELTQALALADQWAKREGVPTGSAHLLLTLFAFPNRAGLLLIERGLSDARVREALGPGRALEPPELVAELRARAAEVARNAGAKEVHCLHLLVALTRLGASRAMQALQACGHEAAPLRNAAVGWLTGTAPRRFVRPGAQGAAARREGAPRAAGVAGTALRESAGGRQPHAAPAREALATAHENEAPAAPTSRVPTAAGACQRARCPSRAQCPSKGRCPSKRRRSKTRQCPRKRTCPRRSRF